MSEVIQLKKFGSSMGTRELGESIREKALDAINKGSHVVFDFSGVSIISSAFADEVFGKIFKELGEEVFKNKIRVNHFDDEDSKKIISFLINKSIAFRRDA